MEADTVIGLLVEQAGRHASKRLYRHKMGDRWVDVTWAEELERIRGFTLGLLDCGLLQGDRVCILSHTRPDWLTLDVSIQAAGGVVVGIYPTMTGPQTAYIINHCEARFLVVENLELLERIQGVRSELKSLERIFIIDGDPPDTTGMEQIAYRLTDELADLPDAQEFHTEKLVFLRSGFLCYKPLAFTPPVSPLPAIERGYFTFGSFNNNCKIQPGMMKLWAQILKSKEKSRLLLKFGGGDDGAVRGHYQHQFEGMGISPHRVKICGRKPTIEHFQMYGQVDVALDTYPYNGTTTTCEAMWMGVPTISLVGSSHVSRVGLSILSRVGLGDFAASTPAEYVGKAIAFSGELENLAKIRTALRAMMFNSPLCDKKGFTRSLEAAYRKMWHKWCLSTRTDLVEREPVAGTPHSINCEPPRRPASKQTALNSAEEK